MNGKHSCSDYLAHKDSHERLIQVTKELTQERERRESSENVLKRFDKISELELRRVVWEHFEKYKSHQSENNK